MGMDVYGKKPREVEGEYFRRSVWSWHPLADYCRAEAPEFCAPCLHWNSNDGDGLDDEGARKLADVLDLALQGGHAQLYVDQRNAHLASLPDEPCAHCGGTGIRTDKIGLQMGMDARVIVEHGHPREGQAGTCNGCNSTGKNRPWATSYHLEVEDIREFSNFLRHCGGFSID